MVYITCIDALSVHHLQLIVQIAMSVALVGEEVALQLNTLVASACSSRLTIVVAHTSQFLRNLRIVAEAYIPRVVRVFKEEGPLELAHLHHQFFPVCPLKVVVLHVERGVVELYLYTILEVVEDGSVDIRTNETLTECIASMPTLLVGITGLTDEIQQYLPASDFSYENYRTNTPARIRMTTLYGIGAILGNAMVANTCNLSEDVMGYSTFYGDSAGSFAPICKLTTDEVVALGDFAGLPKEITHKAPSDGMCGKTDEDNLGWTYHEVNELIRENKKGKHYEKIIERWKKNKFKLDIIRLPCFIPELPVNTEFTK